MIMDEVFAPLQEKSTRELTMEEIAKRTRCRSTKLSADYDSVRLESVAAPVMSARKSSARMKSTRPAQSRRNAKDRSWQGLRPRAARRSDIVRTLPVRNPVSALREHGGIYED